MVLEALHGFSKVHHFSHPTSLITSLALPPLPPTPHHLTPTEEEAYLDLLPWQWLAGSNQNFLITERRRHYLRYAGALTFFEINGPSVYKVRSWWQHVRLLAHSSSHCALQSSLYEGASEAGVLPDSVSATDKRDFKFGTAQHVSPAHLTAAAAVRCSKNTVAIPDESVHTNMRKSSWALLTHHHVPPLYPLLPPPDLPCCWSAQRSV
jgi:hypothetical protein